MRSSNVSNRYSTKIFQMGPQPKLEYGLSKEKKEKIVFSFTILKKQTAIISHIFI